MEHIYASEKLIDNFIKYIEDESTIGLFPEGVSRSVLAIYYGEELKRLLLDQLTSQSGIK